jgi:hypothetical protein
MVEVLTQERARLGDELDLIGADGEPWDAMSVSPPIESSKSV